MRMKMMKVKEMRLKMLIRLADIEPVLAKIEIAMKKANNLLKGTKLKCDKCDFVAKNQNGLTMHKKAKHTDKIS